MSAITDLFTSDHHADDTAAAINKASEYQVAYQKQALEYLKEREAIPQQFREEALTKLGGLYGLEGGEGSQEELIQRAIESPLYKSIIGGREEGEEAILRNMAATGGLRSGNIEEALYDYNTQLENAALLQAYNEQVSGLTGLAGLSTNANAIAQAISSIGETQSSAGIASAQSLQDYYQNQSSNQLGLLDILLSSGSGSSSSSSGSSGLSGLSSLISLVSGGVLAFSDRRLKRNIKKIGEHKGFNIYSFEWNGIANMLGCFGKTIGCMADEVFEKCKDAVFFKDNFLMVNYEKIGIIPVEV